MTKYVDEAAADKEIKKHYAYQKAKLNTDSTAQNYFYSYKRISQLFNTDWLPTKHINNNEKSHVNSTIIAHLKTLSPDTAANLSCAIVQVLISCASTAISAKLTMWQKLSNDFKYKKDVNNLEKIKEPSKKEVDNLITWEAVLKRRDDYKTQVETFWNPLSDDRNYRVFWNRYLLLCLFTFSPPRRISEWTECLLIQSDITNQDKKLNHVNIELKKLFLYEYKTVKSHGPLEINLCDELIEIIKQYNSIFAPKYILETSAKTKFTRQHTIKEFSSIFEGKKISCNMLKKIYQSSVSRFLSIEERIEQAKNIGHSLTCEVLHYSQLDELLDDSDDE